MSREEVSPEDMMSVAKSMARGEGLESEWARNSSEAFAASPCARAVQPEFRTSDIASGHKARAYMLYHQLYAWLDRYLTGTSTTLHNMSIGPMFGRQTAC